MDLITNTDNLVKACYEDMICIKVHKCLNILMPSLIIFMQISIVNRVFATIGDDLICIRGEIEANLSKNLHFCIVFHLSNYKIDYIQVWLYNYLARDDV